MKRINRYRFFIFGAVFLIAPFLAFSQNNLVFSGNEIKQILDSNRIVRVLSYQHRFNGGVLFQKQLDLKMFADSIIARTSSTPNVTTNILDLTSPNILSSTVNGVTDTSKIIKNVITTLAGGNLIIGVNNVYSTPLPIVTSITNSLNHTPLNIMSSTVNGVTDTAKIVRNIAVQLFGSQIAVNVNNVWSNLLDLSTLVGVNIYNANGTLTNTRLVNQNNFPLLFSNGLLETRDVPFLGYFSQFRNSSTDSWYGMYNDTTGVFTQGISMTKDYTKITTLNYDFRINSLGLLTTPYTMYYDPVTKKVTYGLAPSGGGGVSTNLYTANGTLASNRVVDGDLKSLTFNNLSTFDMAANNVLISSSINPNVLLLLASDDADFQNWITLSKVQGMVTINSTGTSSGSVIEISDGIINFENTNSNYKFNSLLTAPASATKMVVYDETTNRIYKATIPTGGGGSTTDTNIMISDLTSTGNRIQNLSDFTQTWNNLNSFVLSKGTNEISITKDNVEFDYLNGVARSTFKVTKHGGVGTSALSYVNTDDNSTYNNYNSFSIGNASNTPSSIALISANGAVSKSIEVRSNGVKLFDSGAVFINNSNNIRPKFTEYYNNGGSYTESSSYYDNTFVYSNTSGSNATINIASADAENENRIIRLANIGTTGTITVNQNVRTNNTTYTLVPVNPSNYMTIQCVYNVGTSNYEWIKIGN